VSEAASLVPMAEPSMAYGLMFHHSLSRHVPVMGSAALKGATSRSATSGQSTSECHPRRRAGIVQWPADRTRSWIEQVAGPPEMARNRGFSTTTRFSSLVTFRFVMPGCAI
jgi:hypothetical protein